MSNSDFTKSDIVKITPSEDKTDNWKSNLHHYIVEFLREIYKCPGCSSPSFTKKRATSRHIYAIVSGDPSECKIIRQEFNCKNKECSLKGCFYNTYNNEDCFFEGRKCTYHFVYYILTEWLAVKKLSFGDIEEKYGISGNEADLWSLSLREEFDSHFDVPTQPVMVFCSFIDKDGKSRGFVGALTDKGSFNLLSFIDNYTYQGLEDFHKRIRTGIAVKTIYFDGSEEIGAALSEMFSVKAVPSNMLNNNNLTILKRRVAERVNKKDSYDSIVIKYLYDSHLCKEKILGALRKASLKHGMARIDFKSGKGVSLFNMFSKYRRKNLLKQFEELPRISGYYSEY